jgi:hypothetical protein
MHFYHSVHYVILAISDYDVSYHVLSLFMPVICHLNVTNYVSHFKCECCITFINFCRYLLCREVLLIVALDTLLATNFGVCVCVCVPVRVRACVCVCA